MLDTATGLLEPDQGTMPTHRPHIAVVQQGSADQ